MILFANLKSVRSLLELFSIVALGHCSSMANMFYIYIFPMLSDWRHMLFKILGPRELTGAVDLLNHFQLLPHFEFFCKRPLPVSISDAHYLYNVVGDIEIRKGDGMQLDQLIQDTSLSSGSNYHIQPLDLDILKEAFQLKETVPIDLPAVRNHLLWIW